MNDFRAYEPQQLSACQDTFKGIIVRRILWQANSPLIGFKTCSIRGYCAWYCNPRQLMAVEVMGSKGQPITATFMDQHDFLLHSKCLSLCQERYADLIFGKGSFYWQCIETLYSLFCYDKI